MDLAEEIARRARALAADLVGWRRRLHAHPELAFQEYDTARFIAGTLEGMGVTVQRPTETGVVADIGPPGGRTVALRADIDALPIREENRVDYASTRPGVMHACGHDGHVAMLLGAARVLSELAGVLPGRVRLIFQPAEEVPPGGAMAMIEAGVLDGVDAAVGLHLWADLPAGRVAVRSGTVMANADEFRITIRGCGGHGSQPHRAVDAVVVAAQTVLNLQTVVSRRIDPLRPAVITVGTVQAGFAFNVIAPAATLTGTVRTLDEETRSFIRAEMARIVEHTCAMAGAEGEFEFFGGYPAVVNHPGVTAVAAEAAAEVLGPDAPAETEPSMGGEDFAHYSLRVPSTYIFLGAANPAKGIIHPHHHPCFDIDEDVLPAGVELLVRTAWKLLADGVPQA